MRGARGEGWEAGRYKSTASVCRSGPDVTRGEGEEGRHCPINLLIPQISDLCCWSWLIDRYDVICCIYTGRYITGFWLKRHCSLQQTTDELFLFCCFILHLYDLVFFLFVWRWKGPRDHFNQQTNKQTNWVIWANCRDIFVAVFVAPKAFIFWKKRVSRRVSKP